MFVYFERCGLNTKFSAIKTHIFGLRRNLMTYGLLFFSCFTIKNETHTSCLNHLESAISIEEFKTLFTHEKS